MNSTCRIITGTYLTFLLGVLNSRLFFFSVKHFYGGVLGESGIRMKHTFFQQFPCIPFDATINEMTLLMSQRQESSKSNALDVLIYAAYGLTNEEITFIESQV